MIAYLFYLISANPTFGPVWLGGVLDLLIIGLVISAALEAKHTH